GARANGRASAAMHSRMKEVMRKRLLICRKPEMISIVAAAPATMNNQEGPPKARARVTAISTSTDSMPALLPGRGAGGTVGEGAGEDAGGGDGSGAAA